MGPKANARTTIEITMFASLSLIFRSLPMLGRAGASIDPLIKVTKPPMDVGIVRPHRAGRDQLKGHSGSSSPLQVTCT